MNWIKIKVNLAEVNECFSTSRNAYDSSETGVDSYEIWWEGFNVKSYSEYIIDEDDKEITTEEWTRICIYKEWVFKSKEYFTYNYIQYLLEDIQLAVNEKKQTYEEALLLNWFERCQQ